ncbi:DNA damage-inducible protein D [Vibrio parahaemolyticus]|uniref:DNA damage-inducible protein D n=1 Tax=Vibrio owensii TaxID=696485 RepID=A0AAP9GEN0_9VIBR|nr:DNA damage-inducible protein D [Vibrio owensii]MBY7872948.1 DNA damage-inducible protein D [Vibrio fluvialis]MDF5080731.1 DNA damage-inducible protein D [Vibrio parahaemolyticus]MDF5101628.1 DNA damage-inducible protein D [Vibrio parahaemolyticus]QGH48545.1 DNA damage-inducible protein D [Vibrio owensii]
MNQELITQLNQSFNQISQTWEDSGIEYWFARDLQELLEYSEWRNFLKVIEKAKEACENSGGKVENHFVAVNKMVVIGSGAEREIDDIMLTRYACYLIAQNGDPRKDAIAFAQTYFALQTRKQELIEEQLRLQDRIQAREKLRESETELSKNIYERGVDDKGFGRIRSRGDAALFGGNTTQSMKNKLSVPKSRALADFLPTVTIAAKNLATEITNHNVRQNDLQGERSITDEHVQNNKSLRDMLAERGIKPEELPAEEDLKKLERRVKSDEKRLIKAAELPKDAKEEK